jgi:hypothetical protein
MASIEKGTAPAALPSLKKPPPPPPGGGAPPACTLQDTFSNTRVGAGSVSQSYIFHNENPTPETILSVTLDTDHPELWQLDASRLTGVWPPGKYQAFSVTFTPPAQ